MRHLKVFGEMGQVRTIALSRRASRLSELSKQGFETARDLEQATEMGATLGLIATETDRHLEDSVAAMEQGLNLLIEKPLTISGHEAEKLRSKASELKRSVYVACVLRFSQSLNVFKEMLPELETIHSVRIEGQSYLPEWQPGRDYRDSFRARKEGGGVLLDLIHEIDYAGWIFGWPESIQAKMTNTGRLGIEAEETAHLMWQSPSGCIVSLTIDFLTRPTRRRMSAFGNKGTLTWDGITGTVVWERPNGESTAIEQSTLRDQMFVDQAKAFVDAASGTLDDRLTTADDGARALAVCDAARTASREGMDTRVDYR